MLKVTARPSSVLVTVDRAKERLNIDDSDHDTDIERLIEVATATLEARTDQIYRPAAYEWRQSHWLRRGVHWHIEIPVFPVRDVSQVAYLDADGVEQIVDAALWYWRGTDTGIEIRFTDSFSFPALYDRPDSVIVSLTAGYDDPIASGSGDDPDLVLPPQAEMAVLFLVGHWFANRESVMDLQTYTVPDTFEMLAAQLRLYR